MSPPTFQRAVHKRRPPSARSRTVRLLHGLVVLVLAAGCVAPPADPPAGTPAAALELPWELIECRYFIADVPVEAAGLEARLPEGFALDHDPSPLAPATGGAPYLGIEAFTCADGSLWASTFTSVVPPEELTVPDHLLFVMWETLVDNATRRDELAARGLPVRDGTVTFFDDPTPAPTTEVRFEIEGVGAIVMLGLHARPGSPFGGDFVEYMEAEDGTLAAWSTHYEADTVAAGQAVVDLPAGSWLADVAGGTRAHGTMITGTWSFTGGSVRVPAA